MTAWRQSILTALVMAALAWGCNRHEGTPHGHPHGTGAHSAGHGPDKDKPTLSETRWTKRLELFVEFPSLVKGQKVRFAAHLTELKTFKAISRGTVFAVLASGGKTVRSKAVPASRPGIFQPSLVPTATGIYSLTFHLRRADGSTDQIAVEKVVVYPTLSKAKAAHKDTPKPSGAISFLKEQQWKMDFATARVAPRTLRQSVAANGAIRPRAAGQALITAPVTGRLVSRGKHFARIGMAVKRDQVLAAIVPQLGGATDSTALQLDLTRARLSLAQAQRTYRRLEALLKQGAVPQRRVADAQTGVAQAKAQLAGAKRRLGQYRGSQRAGGGSRAGQVTVRCPIAGTVVKVNVAPGAFVKAGSQMVHVVDLSKLWLKVNIPEAYIGRVQKTAGAWFEIEGFSRAFSATPQSGARVIALGGVVDPKSRTVPLIYELNNPKRLLRVGLFARVHVLTGTVAKALAVPMSAVIDESGQDVVYVQLGGESFQRRVLKLGVRDGAFVEVRGGLKPQEHVVIKGAYRVRLAASSGAVPAHGHAH